MNACLFGTPAHDDKDVLPVRLSLGQKVQLCCAGCREYISARAFLRVVERRVAEVPVVTDRRSWKPAWLRGLRGRDQTGAALR